MKFVKKSFCFINFFENYFQMLLKIQSRIQNYSKMFLKFSKINSVLIENQIWGIGVLKFMTKNNFLR